MNIKRLFTVPEIIEQFDSGEYSAELLLQHSMKYMKTNNEKRFEAAKAAMQGLLSNPNWMMRYENNGEFQVGQVYETDVEAVRQADILLAELARTEPTVKESLTPDADRCSTCDGSGAVDSGGVTQWGQGIDIPCPECESRRNPDADGWVVRIPTDPIPEKHNG